MIDYIKEINEISRVLLEVLSDELIVSKFVGELALGSTMDTVASIINELNKEPREFDKIRFEELRNEIRESTKMYDSDIKELCNELIVRMNKFLMIVFDFNNTYRYELKKYQDEVTGFLNRSFNIKKYLDVTIRRCNKYTSFTKELGNKIEKEWSNIYKLINDSNKEVQNHISTDIDYSLTFYMEESLDKYMTTALFYILVDLGHLIDLLEVTSKNKKIIDKNNKYEITLAIDKCKILKDNMSKIKENHTKRIESLKSIRVLYNKFN